MAASVPIRNLLSEEEKEENQKSGVSGEIVQIITLSAWSNLKKAIEDSVLSNYQKKS